MWSMKEYLRRVDGVLRENLDACVVELKSERDGVFLKLVGVMSRETGLEYWTCFGLLKDLVWTMEEERVRVGGGSWVGKEVAGVVYDEGVDDAKELKAKIEAPGGASGKTKQISTTQLLVGGETVL